MADEDVTLPKGTGVVAVDFGLKKSWNSKQ